MQNEYHKNIDQYQCHFQLKTDLIINITSSIKPIVLFAKIQNQRLPQHLKHIADSPNQLFDLIYQLSPSKMQVNQQNQLILKIDSGKRVMEYVIDLERVDISLEQSLQNNVVQFQKRIGRAQLQLSFYRNMYHSLISRMRIAPNINELANKYQKIRELIIQEFSSSKQNQNSKIRSDSLLNSAMSNVSNVEQAQSELLCPKNHKMMETVINNIFQVCDICQNDLNLGQKVKQCKQCEFDLCRQCYPIYTQKKYCPNNHLIKFGCASSYYRRYCDKCGKNLGQTKGFTCLSCDYDLCYNCV